MSTENEISLTLTEDQGRELLALLVSAHPDIQGKFTGVVQRLGEEIYQGKTDGLFKLGDPVVVLQDMQATGYPALKKGTTGKVVGFGWRNEQTLVRIPLPYTDLNNVYWTAKNARDTMDIYLYPHEIEVQNET